MKIKTPQWVELKSGERGRIIGSANLGDRKDLRAWVVHFEETGEVRYFRFGAVKTLGEDLQPF